MLPQHYYIQGLKFQAVKRQYKIHEKMEKLTVTPLHSVVSVSPLPGVVAI